MKGMVGNGTQLDTSIGIVTPENIAFQYRVAGPFRRLPAYLLDLLIRFALVVAVMLTLTFSLGMIGVGLWLVIFFVIEWFYAGLFETFWNGQTPGKRVMGIRVVSIEGQPISGWQAVLRNVLRVADALPIVPSGLPLGFYQVGLLAAMMNSRYQRLGDLAAGTMVVVEERHRFAGMMHFAEPEVAGLAAAIPPNFQAGRTLGLALAAYVERRPMFSWARRLEIARHVAEPLRQRLNLPASTSPDLLLCALYQRNFLQTSASPEQAAMAQVLSDPDDPLAWLGEMSAGQVERSTR
jgi:uncharacterized RDD family membrane protein YckC